MIIFIIIFMIIFIIIFIANISYQILSCMSGVHFKPVQVRCTDPTSIIVFFTISFYLLFLVPVDNNLSHFETLSLYLANTFLVFLNAKNRQICPQFDLTTNNAIKSISSPERNSQMKIFLSHAHNAR